MDGYLIANVGMATDKIVVPKAINFYPKMPSRAQSCVRGGFVMQRTAPISKLSKLWSKECVGKGIAININVSLCFH